MHQENPQFAKFDIQNLGEETQNRYNFIKVLGQGSYGIVLSAQDKKTGQPVAIKKVQGIFGSLLDSKRILREIRILSYLHHDNITNLQDVTTFPDFSNFRSLVVAMDLMETDLSHIIQFNPQLNSDHHRYFVYQILRGLKYIHSANVIHRDLKPSNLLVNSDCDLKICDFGLARVPGQQEKSDALSEYVATRWYRAPEVLLCYTNYGAAIDVWSVGCILAELILRKPLFMGHSTLEQLCLINDFLGSPTDEDLRDCTNVKAREYMRSLPRRDPVNFSEKFASSPPEAIDLLTRMLTWDPTKRITVEQALEHPFMAKLHDPFDEPVTYPLDNFEFEKNDITIQELKIYIWNEIIKFHPEFAH